MHAIEKLNIRDLFLSKIKVLRCLVTLLDPTLCDPMDCSLPGSSVHEILQVRILERFAISFSRGSSLTQESNTGLLHCRQILYRLSYEGSPI